MFYSAHFKLKQPLSVRSAITLLVAFLLLGTLVFIYLTYFSKPPKPDARPDIGRVLFPAKENYPSDTLDLRHWKLTLPVTDPKDPDLPLDIFQPELATYKMDPWFTLAPDKKGVIFRAPVNAPTTANSDYPRSELREMTDNGTKTAFWPTKVGTHTLLLEEAITAVPKNKPHVVAGQIHGDDDDLIVIRLDYPKLYVSRSRTNLATLDENYSLGKKFTIKFVAENGQIKVYYNNGFSPIYVLDKKVDQAYFKVGVYTQSNCETEESPDLCRSENYGEAVIYRMELTHK